MTFKCILAIVSLGVAGSCFSADSGDKGAKTGEIEVGVRSVGPGGGGWIECVLPSRHSRERFFVGCDVGGFYISEDGGRNYAIRNRGMEQSFVETIAENPKDENLLLLGGKGGVYRSVDRGENWQWVTNGFAAANPWGYANPITKVVWDETDPKRAWAATGCPRSGWQLAKGFVTGSVYETCDGSVTWHELVDKNEELLKQQSPIVSFSPNSKNPKEMLLTNPKGLWRSEDGGVHWKLANEGLPVAEGYNLRRLARCADHPEIVYLTARQPKGMPLPLKSGVWKSLDGGRSWAKCESRGPKQRPDDGSAPWQHWCDATIAVHPNDPDTLWVAGVTWWVDGMMKSTDGGRSFVREVPKRQGWIDFWGFSVCSLEVSRSWPDVVTFGTSGVIYRSEDGGATWDQRYTSHRDDGRISGVGLEVLCLRKLVPDRFVRNRHYLGFWDIGLMITDDNGKTLARKVNGIPNTHRNSCFTLVQSPSEPKRLFACFGNWGFGEAESRSSCIFATSEDAGENWTALTNAVGFPNAPVTGLALVNDRAPYAFVAAASEGVPERRGLAVSRDGGQTWDRCREALPEGIDVQAVAADGGTIYAASTVTSKHTGHLFRSRDLGRTWESLFPESLKVGQPHAVVAKGDVIAVAATQNGRGKVFGLGGIFLSRDGGKTWKRPIDTYKCSDVCFGADDRTLVVSACPCGWRDPGFGRNEGVWLTRDGGESWNRLVGPGFDRPSASHLAVNPFDPKEIWVGTGGDSVFVLNANE